MSFDKKLALSIASSIVRNEEERGLVESFAEVCNFLADNPNSLSWSSKTIPHILESQGLETLANKYFSAYRRSDFPKPPQTIPDNIVSVIMVEAFEYTIDDAERIKKEHQHAMVAENCVGALLERYLDSVLRQYGWNWCCGNFIKAVDFVRKDTEGRWYALQIKNRNNSENSSSSAIRKGTSIEKWFRSFSKKEETNWDNLPKLMQGYDLSEQNFERFVRTYLSNEK